MFSLGTASVVKALSVYLDAFIDHTIEYHLRQIIEFDIPYLAEYFDALAFAICILIAGEYFTGQITPILHRTR